MIPDTPKKYLDSMQSNTSAAKEQRDVFQGMIDLVMSFKLSYPDATEKELSAYCIGLLDGRGKKKADLR